MTIVYDDQIKLALFGAFITGILALRLSRELYILR